MFYLIFTLICFLVLGLLLLWLARRIWRQTGLPAGEVIYSDTGTWQRVEEPLISRRYGLVGKPDYLVRVEEGGRALTIPVEVKSRKKPSAVYENHVLQLAAYCLLVEDHFKTAPPYGLLRYADATVKIPFNEHLRARVLAAADDIRRAGQHEDVKRNHRDPHRCQQCGYKEACGKQALA